MGPVKAALTDQILIHNDRIWTARPRIDHVAIFQVSAPRISNAAALIALVAAGDLAAAIASAAAALADSEVIASVAAAASVVAIASAVEDLVAAASAASAAGAADGN